MINNAAAGIRTRVTGLGSLCHNHWTTAAHIDVDFSTIPCSYKAGIDLSRYLSLSATIIVCAVPKSNMGPTENIGYRIGLLVSL